ncbi:MAG: SH3 domain-containing protein [Blautia sp.]|nr:SH3 domain-containing protein [Blautia sp.]
MLGGAILLVVLVLFFGIRACAGRGRSSDTTDSAPEQAEQETPETTDSSADTEAEGKIENPLVEADADVKELIESYYKALGDKDIDALKEIEINLSAADEAKVTNAKDYIDRYEVENVYSKEGLEDTSYVVYACFNYICKGISTPVPALSQFYVVTDADGALKIDGGAAGNASISSYTENLKKDADVQALTTKVRNENEKAQETDPELAEFLKNLGEEDTTATASASDTAEKPAEEEGETLTVNTDANVRAAADGDSEIIGGYSEGTKVKKTGQEGQWVQIDYEGQTGYIYQDLLS